MNKKSFEVEMDMTIENLTQLSEAKRNKTIRSFNNKMAKKADASTNWMLNDSSDDELPASKNFTKKTSSVIGNTSAGGMNNNYLLMEHNANYFVNKDDVKDKYHMINYKDIPENTAIEVVQAKNVIQDNKFEKNKNADAKKGSFVMTCRVIDQILPAKEGTDISQLTNSTCIKDIKKVSNPQWIHNKNLNGVSVFKANKMSNPAYFKTCFDRANDHWFDYGTQEVDKNGVRSTTRGRFNRKTLPGEFQVFSNASLEKLIISTDSLTREPIIFYRQTKTDPCHIHNLGRNAKPYIQFNQVSSKKLMEFGFFHKDVDTNEFVPDMVINEQTLIYSRGDEEFINIVSKLLLYLLDVSENDFANNISQGIASHRVGKDFKTTIPAFLDINGSVVNNDKKSRSYNGGTRLQKTRERSRLPLGGGNVLDGTLGNGGNMVIASQNLDSDDDNDEGVEI